MALSAALLNQYAYGNSIPPDAVQINTSTGGSVWVQSSRTDVIAKYRSGELTGGTPGKPEAAPAGVYLVVLPYAGQSAGAYTDANTGIVVPGSRAEDNPIISTLNPPALPPPIAITPITPPVVFIPPHPAVGQTYVKSTNNPLQPSISLISPLIPPPNTTLAQHTREAYSIALTAPGLNFIYQIGEQFPSTYKCGIRNNTVSHDIQATIVIPSYMRLNTTKNVVISPRQIYTFSFSLDENDIRERIFARQLQAANTMIVQCQILAVAGPVYVTQNLPSFSV